MASPTSAVTASEEGIEAAEHGGTAGPSMTAGEAVKPSRDGSRTRQNLLAAAGIRFARSGYSGVTLKEIADDIGVTPGLVVHYFGSKKALFEEVAKSHPGVALPPLVEGDLQAQLEQRARMILANFEDRTARAPGIALLRSLDLDDGALFREVLYEYMLQPWVTEISGQHAAVRLRLLSGLLLGVGLFTVGALSEPDRPPFDEEDAETIVHYLAELLAVCVAG